MAKVGWKVIPKIEPTRKKQLGVPDKIFVASVNVKIQK